MLRRVEGIFFLLKKTLFSCCGETISQPDCGLLEHLESGLEASKYLSRCKYPTSGREASECFIFSSLAGSLAGPHRLLDTALGAAGCFLQHSRAP